MITSIYAAQILDTHRATALDRENAMLLAQRERGTAPSPAHHAGRLAAVAGWFTTHGRPTSSAKAHGVPAASR